MGRPLLMICNIELLMPLASYLQRRLLPNLYRATSKVVSNLLLKPKQRLRFSAWPSYSNGTFALMSTGGLNQHEWSSCMLCTFRLLERLGSRKGQNCVKKIEWKEGCNVMDAGCRLASFYSHPFWTFHFVPWSPVSLMSVKAV